MRIQFCGANRTVTGSCHLIEVNGLRLFLDMGMFQGHRDEANRFNRWLPDDARSVDAMILSHGHLDHCGKIPVATRAGFAGPIYCTPATAEVTRLVLEDSAEIQEEDANYLNRRHRAPGEGQIAPLYVKSDVARALKLLVRTPYRQKTEVGKGVSFTFHDAGHILGSAYVVLEWEESQKTRKLLFTADIGRYNTPIIDDPEPLSGPVDYVITESTYGGKRHGAIDEVGPQLLDAVKYCIGHRSRLIVPAFAVGRTQTVLWYFQRFIQQKLIPPIAIHIDSPMGVEASEIHRRFRENYDQETLAHIGEGDLFGISRVAFARSADESRKINSDHGPCVIIASSPTCEFGRVLHHLKQSVERPENMIVFVGWTPSGTLGRRLQAGERRVRIYDAWYEVNCQVRTIHGLSAHADGEELTRFLAPTLRGETAFYVVHGEEEQSELLAGKLLANAAQRVLVPGLETSVLAL